MAVRRRTALPRYSHLDAFSSFDLRSEVVEYQQVHIPAPDVPDAQPLIKTDQVIREDEVLVSSFTTSLDKGLPNPRKPIEVGPVYLDLAWVRLLPGLLLSGNDEPRAFAIYNTETRSLVQHLITPQGEKKLPEGGRVGLRIRGTRGVSCVIRHITTSRSAGQPVASGSGRSDRAPAERGRRGTPLRPPGATPPRSVIIGLWSP